MVIPVDPNTVAVIGGGIAGLSVAWELAKRERPVTVFEAGAIGGGASGVATSYLEPRLGTTPSRSLEWESLRLWPAFAKELEEQTGIDVGYRADGQWRYAFPDDEVEVRADFEARRSAGWSVEWLEGDALRNLEPLVADECVGAALVRDPAWVDGPAVCRALASAISQTEASAGYRIDMPSEMQEPKRRSNAVREATKVVNIHNQGYDGLNMMAFDAGSGEPVWFDDPDIPAFNLWTRARTVVLANASGANDILAGGSHDTLQTYGVPKVRLTKGTTLFYPGVDGLFRMLRHKRLSVVPRRDGLIVGSSRERGATSLEPNPAVVEELHRTACRILPLLADVVPQPRCGFRALVADGTLNLGRSTHWDSAEGSTKWAKLYWSLSHAGVGYLRAPLVARELAAVIDGEAPNYTAPFFKG